MAHLYKDGGVVRVGAVEWDGRYHDLSLAIAVGRTSHREPFPVVKAIADNGMEYLVGSIGGDLAWADNPGMILHLQGFYPCDHKGDLEAIVITEQIAGAMEESFDLKESRSALAREIDPVGAEAYFRERDDFYSDVAAKAFRIKQWYKVDDLEHVPRVDISRGRQAWIKSAAGYRDQSEFNEPIPDVGLSRKDFLHVLNMDESEAGAVTWRRFYVKLENDLSLVATDENIHTDFRVFHKDGRMTYDCVRVGDQSFRGQVRIADAGRKGRWGEDIANLIFETQDAAYFLGEIEHGEMNVLTTGFTKKDMNTFGFVQMGATDIKLCNEIVSRLMVHGYVRSDGVIYDRSLEALDPVYVQEREERKLAEVEKRPARML